MSDVARRCKQCNTEAWNTEGRLTCGECGWCPKYQRRQILRSNLEYV